MEIDTAEFDDVRPGDLSSQSSASALHFTPPKGVRRYVQNSILSRIKLHQQNSLAPFLCHASS